VSLACCKHDRAEYEGYNDTYFTGENPWGGEDLELVNTRDEYEQYVR
jgi:hypothetical protein